MVPESSLPDGSIVPVYDPAGGANTMAALCLLSAADARTVLRDFTALVDALPDVLPPAVPAAPRPGPPAGRSRNTTAPSASASPARPRVQPAVPSEGVAV
ncbi:ATP-grasp domain-containing protein OS=Streptomyces rimosus subsp. rimosus (strain ATCC / DSM 40260 / JCM 4667 / NRRL 2234) OX=1265868 GN=SRIM_033045 PE=4 SV=1 [Streptomyces rimosus subsp. rimosus]